LIRYWKSFGVEVLVSTADVTTRAGCEELIRMATDLGPVGGIFNLALATMDGVLINQTVENFEQCFAPKGIATQHLHEVSLRLCPELKHFVAYSSISSGLGNPGQSNYAMANSIIERIIEKRHSMGLPAKVLQLGEVRIQIY
jgi:fatty acid synthase